MQLEANRKYRKNQQINWDSTTSHLGDFREVLYKIRLTSTDENSDQTDSRMSGLRISFISFSGTLLSLLLFSCVSVRAENFVAEFEGPEPSWQVRFWSQDAEIAKQERRRGVGKNGGGEFIRIKSSRENTRVRLEHAVPPATVIDELEASVWIKSNHAGFALAVSIALPEVVDPETNTPRTLLIVGDRYQTPGQWQQLKCRTADRAISDQMRLQRRLRQMSDNPEKMYVSQVLLEGQLPPEVVDIQLDDLSLSPLVPFRVPEVKSVTRPIQQVNQSTEEPRDVRKRNPIRFSLHRLQVEGRPFFPRVITYQQEKPEVLASAGINVAWVPDYENTSVTAPLRRQGLWVTSAPPYAKGADGEPLDSDDASLMPFNSSTSSVLFWMLGARMTLDGHPRLTSWTNQIRDADRIIKRPIAADVIENERQASRHVDMLGISRHVIHTNCSLADYRDWMIQRRDQAWPDTFCWTWIQTEPVPAMMDLSRGHDFRPMLEPEQIRMQVYAALAAGCRGLGFWTTTPLSDDSPAARERMLTLTQLNLELSLFEPWLTTGGKPELVPFTLDAVRSDIAAALPRNRAAEIKKNADPKVASSKRSREMQAAMISIDRGALLLPMWLEENSQFVPGHLTGRNLSIIVPGGGQTAAVWEITTTGRLRNLHRENAAGGIKVSLPRLNQTAAILVTSDQALVEEINERIASIQDHSAHIIVELARLKLDRIRQVDEALQNAGAGRNDAWRWLGEARQQLEKAETALRSQQFSEAAQYAEEAMQYGRLLQKNHWEQTVKPLSSPTTSPWAVSFQTLPEHWKMMQRIEKAGNQNGLENLLPSGEFEDIGTLVAEHWQHEQSMLETIESSASLHHVAKQGKFSLRLSAIPIAGQAVPMALPQAPVTVVSPGISVHAGQFVRITGWAKIPQALVGSTEGALIYDNLLGKSGAIRLKATQDWQRFELLRPVPESQDVTVSLSLHGLGELLVDDLKIVAFELGPDVTPSIPDRTAIEPARFSPLDVRRLNPLQKRKP